MDKINIGIIGVQGRGTLAKYWNMPEGNSKITAGFDIRAEYENEFYEMYGGSANFYCGNIEEFLSDKTIDAVAVFSPDFTHEEYVIAALKAGKHVYCEKPLAITAKGCDRIIDAQKKYSKKVMVGFNMRYMPVFRTCKEIIRSGVIGDIKAVWVRHFVGAGGDFYYHDWHSLKKNTNSLLIQKASHDFDMIHWLTDTYTKRVSAFGSLDYYGGSRPNDLECSECEESEICAEYFVAPRRNKCCFREEIDVEDNSVVIMELENGIKATYMQCNFAPDYQRNYALIGTKGRLESFDMERVVVTTKMTKSESALSNREYIIKQFEGSHSGADPLIAKEFIDMIIYDKQPSVDILAGKMSVACGDAAASSMRNGGTPFYIV